MTPDAGALLAVLILAILLAIGLSLFAYGVANAQIMDERDDERKEAL